MSPDPPSTAATSVHPCWSLASAVRLAARSFSVELDEDVLVCALGWPWLVCAVPKEPNHEHWPTYARDAFLIETSRLLSLTVRAVHPPDAARDLWGIAEFRQHFDASYRPIIERALENGQAVLAFRGWTGESAPTWGLVTGLCDEGVGLAGVLCDSMGATLVALAQPPVQVYVIESAAGATPTAIALAGHLERVARRAAGGELDERFGVVTGAAALELWIEAVSSDEAVGTGAPACVRSLLRANAALLRVASKKTVGSLLRAFAETLTRACERVDSATALTVLRAVEQALRQMQSGLSGTRR